MPLKLVPLQRQQFCGRTIDGQVIGPEVYTKKYPVKFPTNKLEVGAFASSATMEGDTPMISWNPKYTTINQVIIRTAGHAYAGAFGGMMAVGWFLNDMLTISKNFAGPCTEVGGATTTHAGQIINGQPNKVKIEVVKNFGFVVGVETISAELEIQFQGQEPKVEYPEPEWLTYVKWTAIGLGILGAVYLGVRVYEARKKG